MARRVRIGILGSGSIARYHARACRAAAGVDLVMAANWRPESLARFAQEWGIERTTTDPDELAGDPAIDAVIVAVPNYLHRPETLRLLAAGKHVLVEKPMAMDAGEAAEMVRAADAAGRLLMVGHMWRFDDQVGWLRRAVAEGLLGDVVKTKGYAVHPPGVGPATGWFVEKDKAGGGVVMDMAIHAIDTARFLLGGVLPAKVYAQVGTRYSTDEVDDDATIMVHWQGGAYTTIETAAWQQYQEAPEGTAKVWGTRGFGRVFPAELHLPLAGASGVFSAVFPSRQEQTDWPMYRRQVEHFADCIREGRQPVPGGREGLVAMQVADAVYQSARTGLPVAIEP